MAYSPSNPGMTDYNKGVLLRSADRDSTNAQQTSSDFTLSFKEPLQGMYEVQWVVMPNTTYNVTENSNTVQFENKSFGGAIEESVLLPPRNYSPLDLATALTTLSAALNWAYDPNALRFTVTQSTGSNGNLVFGENSLLRRLGFASPVPGISLPIFLPNAQSVIAPNVPSLSHPLSVSMYIPEAASEGFVTAGSQRIDTKDPSGNVVGNTQTSNIVQGTLLVPLLAQEGAYVFVAKDNFRQQINIRNRSANIHISLYDPDTRKPLNLNGGEWEMYIRPLNLLF